MARGSTSPASTWQGASRPFRPTAQGAPHETTRPHETTPPRGYRPIGSSPRPTATAASVSYWRPGAVASAILWRRRTCAVRRAPPLPSCAAIYRSTAGPAGRCAAHPPRSPAALTALPHAPRTTRAVHAMPECVMRMPPVSWQRRYYGVVACWSRSTPTRCPMATPRGVCGSGKCSRTRKLRPPPMPPSPSGRSATFSCRYARS